MAFVSVMVMACRVESTWARAGTMSQISFLTWASSALSCGLCLTRFRAFVVVELWKRVIGASALSTKAAKCLNILILNSKLTSAQTRVHS